MVIYMNDYQYMAETCFVTSSGETVTVNGTAQQRAVLYLPPGVEALPAAGQRAVIFPCGGDTVCGGVRADTSGLLPGEVRIRSLGGAKLILKQNGEIELNGVRITREGKILQKENEQWIQK